MSYEDLLISVCTIERNTPGVPDTYGNPAPSWANHLVDEPCRLTVAGGPGSRGGRELKVGAEVVIADYNLFLNAVDVTEQDRVVLGGATYEVLLVATRQDSTTGHHKECSMRVVR